MEQDGDGRDQRDRAHRGAGRAGEHGSREAQAQSELRPVFEKLVSLMQRTSLTPDEKIRVLGPSKSRSRRPVGSRPDLKKQVHAALIKQFPAAACGDMGGMHQPHAACGAVQPVLLTHHLAKVLAHTESLTSSERSWRSCRKAMRTSRGRSTTCSLRVIDAGWTSAQKEQVIDWFAKASKWRGGSTFAGQVNNIFDATIDSFSEDEKQVAYKAAPLFADHRGNGGGARRRAESCSWRCRRSRRRARPWRSEHAARSAGALRQPGVPARRRPGSLAGRGGAPNPTDGERVFRETCAQCHRFGTLGKDYAPDLTKVADRLPRRDILRSIFFPSEKVDPKFSTTVIATKDGATIRGLLVSENAQNVVLKTAAEPEPVTVVKTRIAKRTTEPSSIMPADIADQVTDNGVRDVTAM